MSFEEKSIFIAGSNGLVGSAIVRILNKQGVKNVLTPNRDDLDLSNYKSVREFLAQHKPQIVIDAAAKVGGIVANRDFPTEFLLENLQIQNSLIKASLDENVETFVFLGSSCIYPKHSQQPIPEQELLGGYLEPTNKPYALAKIAGLELVQSIRKQYRKNYFSIMPTNLYGPRDNFHPTHSHVIPGLIRKFVEAHKNNIRTVSIWGSGEPKREFLYVDDCAEGIIHLTKTVTINTFEEQDWEYSHINLGTGSDISIKDLSLLISNCVGYKGQLIFDTSKPDGTPRKLLNVDRLNHLGWSASTALEQGLRTTIDWYLSNIDTVRQK